MNQIKQIETSFQKMKRRFSAFAFVFLTCWLLSFTAQAQVFCIGSNLAGNITGYTNAFQPMPSVPAGQAHYWTTTLTAGIPYTWSNCTAEGGTSSDTYLRIYNAANAIVASADDICGVNPTVTYTPAVSGLYYVHLAQYSCGILATSQVLAYRAVLPLPPTIASFSPASGCANNVPVVITGTNFSGVSAVTFGGTNALSFVVNSPTQITAIPANGATGTIAVTTLGGVATSLGTFTILPSPVISATASPASICLGGTSSVTATGVPGPSLVTVFTEEFANNAQGWTLGTEWGIGSAVAGGNLDPGVDHTPNANNGIAGAVIGGDITTAIHPYYYITSPVINLSGLTNASLNFWRWLSSDYPGYMNSTIDVWNGASWVNIFTMTAGVGIMDGAWTSQTYNITPYINANFQVRFGHNIGQAGAFIRGGWNIDDITITSNVQPTIAWTGPGVIATPAAATSTVTPAATGTSTYTVTVTAANGCTGSATAAVAVGAVPSAVITQSPAGPLPCGVLPTLTAPNGLVVPANGARYYIRDSDPWGSPSFNTGMDAVFGAGNWTALTYGAAAVGTVFVPGTQFVYLEGSAGTEAGQTAYLAANLPAIEAWVNAGGRLLINRGPNTGANTNFGFGGVTNNYPFFAGTVTVTPGDPIGAGPFLPSGYGPYTGSSYAHAKITGGNTVPLVVNGADTIISKKNWGAGMVLFGGYTAPSFHAPAPNAQNLFQNWISYCATSAQGAPLNYVWQPGGATTQSITAPATGVYTVTVTQGSCSSTGTIAVTILPNPTVTASASVATICAGEASVLTGGGANTYLWNPGALVGSPSVTPITTTTYTVTGTDGNGCTATATVTVTVNPLSPTPTPVTATPAAICAGGTSQLNSTAAPGNVQSWYTVPSGGVAIGTSLSGVDFAVTPAVTTTYYAENLVGAPGGTQTFNYTGSLQTFTVPAGVTSLTMDVRGAQGGDAQGIGGLGARMQGNLTVTPGQVLTILVGQKPSSNGGGGGTFVVDAANNAQIVAGGGGGGAGACCGVVHNGMDAVVTTAGTAGLNASGGVGPGGTGGNGAPAFSSGQSSGAGGGFFTSGGAGDAGALGGQSFILGGAGAVGAGNPGGYGGGGSSHCVGGAPNGCAGGGGGGYSGGGNTGGGAQWGGGGGGGSFSIALAQNNTPGFQTGNGQVVITWAAVGAACPSVRVPVTVTVNPLPTVTASASPAAICAGGSSVLTGGGADTYLWNPGALTGTPTVTPAVTTTYTVVGTDLNGCTGSATASVTVNSIPDATITQTPGNPLGCGVIPTLSVPAAGNKYYIRDFEPWGTTSNVDAMNTAFGVGNYTTLNYAAALPGTVFVPATQFVFIDGSDGNSGLPAYLTANLAAIEAWVNAGGRLFLNAAPNYGGNFSLGFGGTSLNNGQFSNSVTVNALHPIVAGPNLPTGTSFTGSSYGHATITNGGTVITTGVGDVLTEKTWGAGKVLFGGITSPVFHTPTANSQNMWANIMTYTAGAGGAGNTYLWAPNGELTASITANATGVYSVTVTSAAGCTSTSSISVTLLANPVITATATPATTCNQTVVTPSASGAPTIAWTGGLTNNVPFIANATTIYTVTGTDGNGCTGSTTVLVTVNPMSGILAPATTNQTQDHGDDFNVNYYDASCDLIATVDDGAGGNILGLTTSTVTVDPGFGVHNGQPFVRRWYQITPTNNGAADVVLYINQSDFDNYNLGVALPYLPLPTSGNNADPNISNIRITKNTDAGLGNSPVVITPTVNWNGTYWELSFNTPSFSQFRVHSVNPGNVPLPATVTNFSGVKLESSDKLSWTTSSEQNNAYFNLQHSTDGTNFTTLAKVNSKAQNGNSSVALNYSSINSKPSLGHNYYRLQQVDMDGKVSVHAQIVDLIWGATGSTVSIYPNPTTDILNIDLYAVKDQNTTVKLLDMSGRVIKQIQAKSAIGMNNIKLSMGEIASGVYTIQVYENNTLSHTSKVKKND